MEGFALEKGRNGTSSSSSSSASDKGFKRRFPEECLGRRANMRLRFMGCRASASEDEEEDEESLTIAEGLALVSAESFVFFGDASNDLRRANDGLFSLEVRGEALGEVVSNCLTVFVEVVRDNVPKSVSYKLW